MALQDTPSAETCSDTAATRGGGDQRALAGWLAGLGRLAEVGHRIVERLAARMESLAHPARLYDLVEVYDRVCWAIRLLAALHLKLLRDAKILSPAQAPVKPSTETDRPETERLEPLDRERGDRLDSDGFGPLLKRPVEEVVAIICRALGFTPELRRLVEAAWAGEEIADDDSEPPVVETPQEPRRSRRSRARPSASPGARRVIRPAPA